MCSTVASQISSLLRDDPVPPDERVGVVGEERPCHRSRSPMTSTVTVPRTWPSSSSTPQVAALGAEQGVEGVAQGDRRPGAARRGRRPTAGASTSSARSASGEPRQPLEGPVVAEERLDERRGRRPQQLVGRAVLLEHPAHVEQGDPVGHLDRLVDVVGDEEDRLVQAALEVDQVVLQAGADHGVDRAVGLVHQQHRRVGGQGPGHADALLLAARERRRVPAQHATGRGRPARSSSSTRARVRFLSQPSRVGHGGDVVADGAVREQPDLLDHVADAPAELVDGEGGGVDAVDEDAAARRGDEPVHHLEDGGLPAARRADHRHQLAGRDVEVEGVDRGACPRPGRSW